MKPFRLRELIPRLYSKTNIESFPGQVLKFKYFIRFFDTEIEVHLKSGFRFTVIFMSLLTFMMLFCV